MFFYRYIQSNLDTSEIYKFTSVGSQIPTSIRLSKQYIMIWFRLAALVGAESIFLAVGRFLESTKKITALLFCILMYVSNTNFLNILSKSFWLISIDCLKRLRKKASISVQKSFLINCFHHCVAFGCINIY